MTSSTDASNGPAAASPPAPPVANGSAPLADKLTAKVDTAELDHADQENHATPSPDRVAEAAHAADNHPEQETPVQAERSTPADANMLASEYFSNPLPQTPLSAMNPMTPIDPISAHAYMMLQFSRSMRSQVPGPSIVTPAQVTLPTALANGPDGLGGDLSHAGGPVNPALQSFARIEFADSVFQMTTYAVMIGRDQRAMEQARKEERLEEEWKRRVEENASKGLPPPEKPNRNQRKFSRSYVSEEGGMLGPESDGDDEGRPVKRRKTSTAGSANHEAEEVDENLISNRQYVSHTPGAAAVDLTSLRPSPHHVPFIGIHSPGPDIASKTKAISREHLRIEFNPEKGVFEAIPLHKNGFFIDDVHHKEGHVVLRSGDHLQIKDVGFVFVINGVQIGHTGAEDHDGEEDRRYSEGGKEMSFEFESSHGNGDLQDTSDELSDVPLSQLEQSDDDNGAEAESEGEARDEAEPALEPEPLPPPPPKKRGPGRPPKNGIMSKREQRLLKKQQQELAKKTLPQQPPVEPPVKRKVGRPRKHPLPDDGSGRPEKRKYKPRKPREEGAEGAEGSDAEKRAKEKKEKKVRAKTPPLELNKDDYTDEQLQKPAKNYGVLIDETLTAAGPDGLTLKQIYKRICQKYPYFYFITETKGWESSVRHNLIGNEAFKKDETTGLWSRVPGVELDAGKKRKASSPDRSLGAQGYAYAHQMYQQYPGVSPAYPPPPPGYQPSAYPAQAGQPPRQGQPYPAPTAAPGQPGAPAPVQLPGYGPTPPPPPPQLSTTQASTYSSPYASRPPTANGPPAAAAASASPQPTLGQASPGVGAPAALQPGALTPQPAGSSTARPMQPPAVNPARPVIDPSLLARVVSLKNEIIRKLRSTSNPKPEVAVMSALNRVIGLKTSPKEAEAMEKPFMQAFRSFITKYLEQNKPAFPVPPAEEGSDSIAIMESVVLAGLVKYKTAMVGAIKTKIGEEKAEAMILSAIDRVLGLADASALEQALEGSEQNIMRGVKNMLGGMGLAVHGS